MKTAILVWHIRPYHPLYVCTKAPGVNNIYCIFSLKSHSFFRNQIVMCHSVIVMCHSTKTSLSTSCWSCSSMWHRWCLIIMIKNKTYPVPLFTAVVQNYILRQAACSSLSLIAPTVIAVPKASFTPFNWDYGHKRVNTVSSLKQGDLKDKGEKYSIWHIV